MDESEKKLNNLLYYAGLGVPIFPCHELKGDRRCSCDNQACRSPGKHPRTSAGFYDATVDQAQIRAWHDQWPGANWGMRCGQKAEGGAGILVVDIDRKSGGIETWDLMREEHPEPLETITVATGGGGVHLWFEHPEGQAIRSGAGVLGQGIDIRADGGYVIIPPSKTIAPYKFELKPSETTLSPLPDWIKASLNGRVKTSASSSKKTPAIESMGAVVAEGGRHDALVKAAGSMRRIGMGHDEILAGLMVLRDARLVPGEHPTTDEEVAEIATWICEKPVEYHHTDLGNAQRFADHHADDVRYCPSWKSWLVWDGCRWKVDDTLQIMRKAHDTVRSIYAEASNQAENDSRKATAKHALKTEARSRIDAMVHESMALLPVRAEDLDTHTMLINVRNGSIDLLTGDLHPHNRGHMITKLIDIEYSPTAEAPRWESFLKLVTGGDEELQLFLQLAVGYSLTGLIDEHCLFFLVGDGMNGKSTFTETIRRMMGDYARRTRIDALMETYNAGDAANPYVADMAGARFVLCSEMPENRKWNEPLVKDLTGGDTIAARFLFSNPFTFESQHKLWLFGNHRPKVTGTDLGFWRRMRIIPFGVTIPEEVRMPMSDVLAMFDAEMPGILSWAVAGCLLWQSNGLPMPGAVKTATEEYKTEQDVLAQFLADRTELHPDYSVNKKTLYAEWRTWCEDTGELKAKSRSQKWLTRQLTTYKGCRIGGHAENDILGIRVLTQVKS